ncbi:MAG TPA: nuclear transport factor 2 family protein [Candidatus Paceibacterota bacterium]
MNTLELVQKLNKIIVSGNNEGLSDIIADDIIFNGPLFKASGKEEFVNGFERWLQTKKTYALLKQFTADSAVASFYEINVETPAGIVTLKEADWIEARDGKIIAIKVYFDPRELLKATGR